MTYEPSTAGPEKDESDNRFEFLFERAKKFCKAVGLREDLVLDIYKSDTDWSFILKIDALVDTAAKSIIKKS
jgi:hypothetical protein